MLASQFDIRKITQLKDLIIRFRDGEEKEIIQNDFNLYFEKENTLTILLIMQEVFNGFDKITASDMELFTSIFIPTVSELPIFESDHPVSVFLKENKQFNETLTLCEDLLHRLSKQKTNNKLISELQDGIDTLGDFQKHYHRKQKLFFPILERYGHHTPTRVIWRRDDRVYALYQGVKKQVEQLPEVEIEHIEKTFQTFEKEFRAMIYQEEAFLLPILTALFSEKDWQNIAEESDAFGFAIPVLEDVGAGAATREIPAEMADKNLPFGSGFLTMKEANLILNNLPLEITFVDKNSIFKYFNNITKSPNMMFIRTPISLGRNVADCHPPKSLKKVMSLVRDLKTKKRDSESMWFRKEDKYIHITYKALFDEEDVFMGILEYVQDVQPFFNLPSEVKRNLSPLDE